MIVNEQGRAAALEALDEKWKRSDQGYKIKLVDFILSSYEEGKSETDVISYKFEVEVLAQFLCYLYARGIWVFQSESIKNFYRNEAEKELAKMRIFKKEEA